MSHQTRQLLSVVVPLFNEAEGLSDFHASLVGVLESLGQYEVIYVDDGSTDATVSLVKELATENSAVRLLRLSRNFGKENALTAGIAAATGDAVLMIDGDGQHPVEKIPAFVEAWREGSKVVIGVRVANSLESWFKRQSSKLFYRLFNRVSQSELVPGSTDFRLIDREVQRAFLQLPESGRLTRGLIDWLGFERSYIMYAAHPRQHGTAAYSNRKLVRLAADSFVSLTTVPLYFFGYLGLFITTAALALGLTVLVEQVLLHDPLGWNFTGTAMLSVLILFLVGVLLLSQGMLALYISHIHNQTKRRPLYIIDYSESIGIKEAPDRHA